MSDLSLTLHNPIVGEVYYSTHTESHLHVLSVDDDFISCVDLLTDKLYTLSRENNNNLFDKYYIIRGKRKRKILKKVMEGKYSI